MNVTTQIVLPTAVALNETQPTQSPTTWQEWIKRIFR